MPAIRPEDVPDGWYVDVFVHEPPAGREDGFLTDYTAYRARVRRDPDGEPVLYYDPGLDRHHPVAESYARLYTNTHSGDVLVPHFPHCRHGWGPLLYEIAIEVATVAFDGACPAGGAALLYHPPRGQRPYGIHPWGNSDSAESQSVWRRFYGRADVAHSALKSHGPYHMPGGDTRRCSECASHRRLYRGKPWEAAVYRKRPDALVRLDLLGKLRWRGPGAGRLLQLGRDKHPGTKFQAPSTVAP